MNMHDLSHNNNHDDDTELVKTMTMTTMTAVIWRFYKCVVEEALLGKDPDGAEDFSAGLLDMIIIIIIIVIIIVVILITYT